MPLPCGRRYALHFRVVVAGRRRGSGGADLVNIENPCNAPALHVAHPVKDL